MINLIQSNIDIAKASKEHLDFFNAYAQIKLKGINRVPDNLKLHPNLPDRKHRYKTSHLKILENFLSKEDVLKSIILGQPQTLLKLHKDLVKEINDTYGQKAFQAYLKIKTKKKREGHPVHKLYLDINSIFDYERFVSFDAAEKNYSSYKLADNLGVRSCTFCNRTYTITRRTRSDKKLMRPQFDHWFPKKKYPLLAVSFYNLIPCCTYCNSSVKGDAELNLKDHSHPYVDEPDGDSFEFDYDFDTSLNSYKIFLRSRENTSGKHVRTSEYLKIDQMYEGHQAELKDLIKLRQAYGIEYIKKMADLFPDKNLSAEEVYRLLFGTEIDEKNFHKRPFSKFKHDILHKIEVLE